MTFEDVKKIAMQPLIQMDSIGPQVYHHSKLILAHYAGLIGELTVVPVLTGALPFAADLIRNIRLPVKVEPIRVTTYSKSYGVPPAPGEGREPVCCNDDLTFAEGRHILIVEDILDSGATLAHLMARFRAERATSVEVITLLRKNGTQKAFLEEPKWVLFNIPDVFVAGYGMDYAGYHRNLPFVAALNIPKKPKIELG